MMTQSLARLGAILLLFLLISTPVAAQVNGTTVTNDTANPAQECGFRGNSDMYGLGIRLGIYIQGFATTISGAYRQESSKGIAFANSFYQFAMFIALTYMTVTDDSFEVVEAAIIVIFTFCSVQISSPEELKFSRPKSFGHVDLRWFMSHTLKPLGKLSIDLGLNLYSVWFWWRGLDVLQRSPCTGWAFFFVKLNFFGWIRVLGRIGCILLVLMELWILYRVIQSHFSEKKALPGIMQFLTSPQKRHRVKHVNWIADFTGAFMGCCIIGFYIASVEMMIIWNHIRDVDVVLGSMGQLIPFLIGIGSMCAVILEWGGLHKTKDMEVQTDPIDLSEVDLESQNRDSKTLITDAAPNNISEKRPLDTTGRLQEDGHVFSSFWSWLQKPYEKSVWRWYTV